jgi:hypothetical protein
LRNLEEIFRHYERQVTLPWRDDLAADYRVWILLYDKSLERRVRGRLFELEDITRRWGHGWRHLDLSRSFGAWIATHELFDGLLDFPDEIQGLFEEFARHVVAMVRDELEACSKDDVLALFGCGSFFGVLRVSRLIEEVAPAVPGRLLVLFPGRHEGEIYRLLDAGESWNYRATPIPPTGAD